MRSVKHGDLRKSKQVVKRGWAAKRLQYGTCDLQPRRSDATLEVFGENNYVCNTIRWLKKKITMGLAVSPQLANLCCHTVERDFVLAPKRTDEAAFRWIDDILTFGSIPSEEQCGMQYKQTLTEPLWHEAVHCDPIPWHCFWDNFGPRWCERETISHILSCIMGMGRAIY